MLVAGLPIEYTSGIMSNLTLRLRKDLVEKLREKANSSGKTLERFMLEEIERLVNSDTKTQKFLWLSGQGNSAGWKFDRDEIHERA